MSDEKVLCITARHFEDVGYFEGFQPFEKSYLDKLLAEEQFSFQLRSACETDPSYKQLIPYIVLQCGDLIFQYRRGGSGTEKRLLAKRSIGIGGHISEADAAGGMGKNSLYRNGMLREIMEEVNIEHVVFTESTLGFIYDASKLVGQVHLGVVHHFQLQSTDVTSRESALAEAGFLPIQKLIDDYDQFETWSQLTLDELKKYSK